MVKKSEFDTLTGCGPVTKEKLETNGITTLLSMATSGPSQIATITGLSENKSRALIKQAREQCDVGFNDGLATETELNKHKFLSTGCTPFDEMMGGGFKPKMITQVYGATAGSKTQLSHLLAVMAIKENPEQKVIYIDTESTFKPDRIRQIAEANDLDADKVLKNINVARAHSFDHQMMLVDKAEELMQDDENYRLMIIDSLTSHVRAEFIGRGTLADRQQKLNKHMHVIMRLADIYNVVVMITNQISSNPGVMYGNPDQAIGGNIVSHNCGEIIYVRRGKAGARVAKLVDSSSLPETECEYKISEKGIEEV